MNVESKNNIKPVNLNSENLVVICNFRPKKTEKKKIGTRRFKELIHLHRPPLAVSQSVGLLCIHRIIRCGKFN